MNYYKVPYKLLMRLVGEAHYEQLCSILDTLEEDALSEEKLAWILVVQRGSARSYLRVRAKLCENCAYI
ncbi:MAG: hypothetical protein ABS948_08285 [Solibacillus sp.]